jgi:thioester reductase-like protein
VRSYHSLKAANVLGTQEVLRLAVTNGFATRVKPVHYVSTNGVFPFGDEAPPAGCTETADVAATWRDLKVNVSHVLYGMRCYTATLLLLLAAPLLAAS